jgi:hypothetical protein
MMNHKGTETIGKGLPITPLPSEKLKRRYTALQKAAILTINNNNNNNNNIGLRFEYIKGETGSKIVAGQDQAVQLVRTLKIKV